MANSSARIFPIGTILMALYGQGKTRGMTGLLKVPCATNQACAGICVTKTDIDIIYLWKFLISAYNVIRERANGSGQPNLSGELISNLENGLVFSRDGDTIWQCRNCGHIVIGKEAPKVCPVCAHPQSYFEVKSDNYL